jgi:hypothetical protein
VETAENIAECVEELLAGDGELGGETDWQIEQWLQDLYGLGGNDMIHITSQMGLVAYHQAMQELYPDGKPQTPERKQNVRVNIDASASESEADD